MSSKITPTALPVAPKEYTLEYMNRLIRQINLEFTKMAAITPFTCGSDLSGEAGFPISGLTIVNVPTSPTGLPSGSVWSDGGTLKIVS